MFTYLWRFDVRAEHIAEFERIYGPDGNWVALFRGGEGYRSTQLLADCENAGRYLTVDSWDSAAAYDAFRAAHALEFAALDEHCERLTASETLIGRYETIGVLK